MGVVYEAFDRDLETTVALKYLPNRSPESIFRFKREFRSLQNLQHENLVRFGELVHDGPHLFFTMELVDGVDIVSYCRHVDRASPRGRTAAPFVTSEDPTLDDDEPAGSIIREPDASVFVDEVRVRRAFAQLVRALIALHGTRKVHRDIKPANVLVGTDGRVVLLDFGVVSEVIDESENGESHLIGSVAYMAPEQTLGGSVSVEADYYAVGAMLFEVLTQRLPFEGQSSAILAAKKRTSAPRATDFVHDSPADLSDLCARLLEPRPERRPDGPAILEALVPSDRPYEVGPAEDDSPFVGRETELRTLEIALNEATLGRVRVIHIEGGSGTGKTRLVRQFLGQLAARDDIAILNGRCSVREHVPYKALDGVVDDLADLVFHSIEAGAEWPPSLFTQDLLSAFPSLGRVIPAAERTRPEPLDVDPYVRRVRLLDAFRALFGYACRERTLIVVVDDAQSADADSITLLSALVRTPPGMALLVLTIGQPSYERTLRRSLDGQFLELRSLTPAESSTLAEALLAREGIERSLGELVERIAVEAAGQPFFIEALVNELVRSGGNLPSVANLESAISSRAAKLRAGPRLLVQLAAVAEHPLPLKVLVSAAAIAQEASIPPFLELQPLYGEHWLRFDGTSGSNRVEPYHDRLAAAIRSTLSAADRQRLHGAIALALENERVKDPGELATHWSRAGEKQKAARYALAAAAVAERTLAFAQAARLYQISLEDWPEQPEATETWEKLGDALGNAGLGSPAARAYMTASDRSSDDKRLELQRRAADQLFRSGHIDLAEPIIRRVLEPMGLSIPRSSLMSLALLLLSRARLRIRGLRVAARHVGRVDARALVQLNACWSVAVGLSMVNNIRGACLQTRHLILALKVGQPLPLLRALAAEATYTAVTGHRARKRVEYLLAQADRLAEGMNDPPVEGFRTLMKATCHFLMGEWQQARSFASVAEDVFMARPAGAMWELSSARTFGLWGDFYLGNLSTMRERIEHFIPEAETRGDRYAATLYRTGLTCMAWLAIDRPEFARSRVIEAEAGWSRVEFDFQAYLKTLGHSLIDLYEGYPASAHQRLVAIWPALSSSLYLRIQNVRIEASYFRGVSAIAAAAQGKRGDTFLRDAGRCAARLQREKTPGASVFAEFLRAGIAELSGSPDLLSRWQRAEQAAGALGMQLFADAALFRRLNATGGASALSALDKLRERISERDIRNPDRLCALLAPGRPWEDRKHP